MQALGLIGLLITIALAAWWLTSAGPVAPVANEENSTGYKNALDSAREAADAMGGSVALSGASVAIYDGVVVAKDVDKIDLSGRGLRGSLKAEVRLLTELRELDLSHNHFTGLPAEVGQLTKLEVLNLSNNPLTGLPHELGNLNQLKTLDLRNTQYATSDLEVIRTQLPATVVILVD